MPSLYQAFINIHTCTLSGHECQKSLAARETSLFIGSQYAEYAGDGGGLRAALGHELHEVGLEAVRGHVEVGAGLQQQLAV